MHNYVANEDSPGGFTEQSLKKGKYLVCTGWAISLFLCANGLRIQSSRTSIATTSQSGR